MGGDGVGCSVERVVVSQCPLVRGRTRKQTRPCLGKHQVAPKHKVTVVPWMRSLLPGRRSCDWYLSTGSVCGGSALVISLAQSTGWEKLLCVAQVVFRSFQDCDLNPCQEPPGRARVPGKARCKIRSREAVNALSTAGHLAAWPSRASSVLAPTLGRTGVPQERRWLPPNARAGGGAQCGRGRLCGNYWASDYSRLHAEAPMAVDFREPSRMRSVWCPGSFRPTRGLAS